jgi:hypothetical protein
MNYKLTLICMLMTLFMACKKNPANLSKKELLTRMSWRITNWEEAGQNVYSYVPYCQKDDRVQYNSDGNGVIDDGSSKCSTEDTQTQSFTWSLENSDTELHISNASGNKTFKVLSLNEDNLKLQLTSSSMSEIFTYGH